MGAAAVPMIVGSAIGAATNRKNPIQGAMLGGFLGGAGSAFMPALSGLGGAAGTAATTTAAGTASSALPTAAFTGSQVVPAANMAPFAMNPAGLPAIGGITPMTAPGPSTGLIPSSMADSSLIGSLTSGLEGIGQYAQQNPVLTQMAMQGGQSLLQQQPSQPLPGGLMRGNPTQAQGPQYQFGPPKVSLI